MPKTNYTCKQCNKDFEVTYIFFKSVNPQCPHCGSSNVGVSNNIQSRGCGSKQNNSGCKFT